VFLKLFPERRRLSISIGTGGGEEKRSAGEEKFEKLDEHVFSVSTKNVAECFADKDQEARNCGKFYTLSWAQETLC